MDRPDFHICIGDDFSVARVRTITPTSLAQPYLLQRPFLGLVGQTAPIFLMNGNHEQASLFNYNQTDERRDVAVGVQVARNHLYPTPAPDAFYSGNPTQLKDIGLLKNYCAWVWGDALFVLLDNYWHSAALVDTGFGAKAKGDKGGGGGARDEDRKNRDWWDITIGDAQYQWLKKTLETSKAKYQLMMMKTKLVLIGFAALVLMAALSDFAPGADGVPDLTKSVRRGVNREQTYNLGPTGLRGWIHTNPETFLDSVQGRTTAASRQILVTLVGAKSPADGVLKVNDVILGVGEGRFSDDARKSFGRAITEAEKAENKGILPLTISRKGKTAKVQLKLKVMGSYSATAPYDCEKSKRILAEACRVLEKEPLNDDQWGAVNGLALLATGKREYLPKVEAFARSIVPDDLPPDTCDTWDWGYKDVFLCEYYLLTGDKQVLPGIKKYTMALARGQGMYGTFGHGGAEKTADGKWHGSVPPYGPVNQCGLIANLAIVLGRKCGVADQEVDDAIGRAANFFAYYIDKGSIPYGEHIAWPYHENNGKNALAALMFAIQGDRKDAQRFFAKMCTAAYENREYGHTGQGFSYLWGTLGANAGGPDAAAAFFKEAAWHLDLVRRCDGAFTYDGDDEFGAGKTENNTYYGASSYEGLSPTATYVLTYSMSLRKLCITGRDLKQENRLSMKDVDEAIASGRFDLDCRKKSPQELVAAFADWSPVVRGWAANELSLRPEAKAMVPELITLAEGQDAHVRQGACEALGCLKSTDALAVLVRLLKHEDRWLRVKAADALKNMGNESRPVLPDMLKAVADTAEPLTPIVWADPVQLTHGELAAVLFADLMKDSIEGIDRKLLYPAIRAVSRNADGMARMQLRNTFEKQLTLEDVQALAPDIFAAADEMSPADTMFSNEIRMGAYKALTKYHFKEGIRVGVKFARTQGGHGSEERTGEIMKELTGYGKAAREILPDLRALIVQFNTECANDQFPEDCNKLRVASVRKAIKTIEAAKTQPELRGIDK